MYASLITAGASQLYDLYKSVTSSSSTSSAKLFEKSTSDASSSDSSTSSTGAVNSASSSGSSFSSALHKLFVDLQASTSASTSATASADQTNTIAGDLQAVFKGAKGSGQHAGPPPSTDGTASAAAGKTGSLHHLASSLLAYAKTHSLSAGSSTSFSA